LRRFLQLPIQTSGHLQSSSCYHLLSIHLLQLILNVHHEVWRLNRAFFRQETYPRKLINHFLLLLLTDKPFLPHSSCYRRCSGNISQRILAIRGIPTRRLRHSGQNYRLSQIKILRLLSKILLCCCRDSPGCSSIRSLIQIHLQNLILAKLPLYLYCQHQFLQLTANTPITSQQNIFNQLLSQC